MMIQRKRTKGWRMPPNARYVGRPTIYGNPYIVAEYGRERAIELYEVWLDEQIQTDPTFLDQLRGKDLACFCPLDTPCHADVLLKWLEAA